LCTLLLQVLILQRVLTIVLWLGCSYARHCKLLEVCLISTMFQLLNLCLCKRERNLDHSLLNTVRPTRYRTWHFFNNSKFEQDYVRCVRNEEECVCSVCMCA
jgi:hypothetical protein